MTTEREGKFTPKNHSQTDNNSEENGSTLSESDGATINQKIKVNEGHRKIKYNKGEFGICHDENCPKCGWVETIRVCDKDANTIRFECYKCGWKEIIK